MKIALLYIILKDMSKDVSIILLTKKNKRFTVITVFHNVFLCIVRTHGYHKFTLNVIYHRSAVHFNTLIEIHALRTVLTNA